jgi:acetyl esterase/lipase
MKNKVKKLMQWQYLLLIPIAFACKKNPVQDTKSGSSTEQVLSADDQLSSRVAVSPPSINNDTLFENVQYDTINNHLRTKFDLFVPKSAFTGNKLVPLVIFVHGGGFGDRDKDDLYSSNEFASDIQPYIDSNIAIATVNYRYKQDFSGYPGSLSEGDAILNCIGDVQRCLQFIRYKAARYKIKKGKIGMFGSSAGGGATLRIGLFCDKRNASSLDPVLQQSTRVQAIGHNNSQATYSPYHMSQMFTTYLYPTCASGSVVQDQRLNFLDSLTSDDPKIYVRQIDTNSSCISSKNNITHHPVHAKAIYDKADLMNRLHKKAQGYSEIRKFNIPWVPDPLNRPKSMREFMTDILKN